MKSRKWPILAQMILAIGCAAGVRGAVLGFTDHNNLELFFGILSIVIFCSVFIYQLWALYALYISLSFNVIFIIIGFLRGLPLWPGIVPVLINILIIYYFSRKSIKDLFIKSTP